MTGGLRFKQIYCIFMMCASSIFVGLLIGEVCDCVMRIFKAQTNQKYTLHCAMSRSRKKNLRLPYRKGNT